METPRFHIQDVRLRFAVLWGCVPAFRGPFAKIERSLQAGKHNRERRGWLLEQQKIGKALECLVKYRKNSNANHTQWLENVCNVLRQYVKEDCELEFLQREYCALVACAFGHAGKLDEYWQCVWAVPLDLDFDVGKSEPRLGAFDWAAPAMKQCAIAAAHEASAADFKEALQSRPSGKAGQQPNDALLIARSTECENWRKTHRAQMISDPVFELMGKSIGQAAKLLYKFQFLYQGNKRGFDFSSGGTQSAATDVYRFSLAYTAIADPKVMSVLQGECMMEYFCPANVSKQPRWMKTWASAAEEAESFVAKKTLAVSSMRWEVSVDGHNCRKACYKPESEWGEDLVYTWLESLKTWQKHARNNGLRTLEKKLKAWVAGQMKTVQAQPDEGGEAGEDRFKRLDQLADVYKQLLLACPAVAGEEPDPAPLVAMQEVEKLKKGQDQKLLEHYAAATELQCASCKLAHDVVLKHLNTELNQADAAALRGLELTVRKLLAAYFEVDGFEADEWFQEVTEALAQLKSLDDILSKTKGRLTHKDILGTIQPLLKFRKCSLAWSKKKQQSTWLPLIRSAKEYGDFKGPIDFVNENSAKLIFEKGHAALKAWWQAYSDEAKERLKDAVDKAEGELSNAEQVMRGRKDGTAWREGLSESSSLEECLAKAKVTLASDKSLLYELAALPDKLDGVRLEKAVNKFSTLVTSSPQGAWCIGIAGSRRVPGR